MDNMRLELLRLCYTHAKSAEDAVTRARVLEAYVVETTRKPRSKPQDSTGTPASGSVLDLE